MRNSLNIHEDQRRRLIDFGKWAETKIVTCLEYCVLGNHFHKEKEEMFYILDGVVKYDGEEYLPGMCINIPKGKHHIFECEPDTRILGLASKEYDPTDEHKL